MNSAISRLNRAGTGSDEQTYIGPYPLLRRLAAGGMAELFLAWQGPPTGKKRLVVVKRVLPRYAENEYFVSMFLDEANISALLQHPNIVQVIDWGQDEHGPFYAMEYVRGVDLRKLLNQCYRTKRVVPLQLALKVVVDAAAGLHAAHELRDLEGRAMHVVHRDISLSNILVSYDGAVKILDFGIAKAARRRAETQSGFRKGKISYMSPEQVRDEALDRRSDVFSLGVVLFELSCGRRLHQADNLIQVARDLAVGRIDRPSAVHHNYPPELEAIVCKALAPKPEDRFQSARELQCAIEDYASRAGLRLSNADLAIFISESFRDERTLRGLLDAKPAVEERVLEKPREATASEPALIPLPTLVSPPANDAVAGGEEASLSLDELEPELIYETPEGRESVSIPMWLWGAGGLGMAMALALAFVLGVASG